MNLQGLVRTTKDIDLLGQACGIDYAAALAGSVETRDVMGVGIPVASKVSSSG